MQVNGLVLCGGKSTRMGEDKSLINYNGTPQFAHCYNLLSQFCEDVFLSCNATQVDKFDPFPCIIDQNDGLGPLEGIRNAFESDPTANWLIMPCDMPLISKVEIEILLKNQSENVDAICFKDGAGNINPLFGIWSSSCAKLLKAYNGDSPRKFLESLKTKYISVENGNLANINYPTER